MVDVATWSETPGSNTTIDGTNIAENCSPGALNNMGRAIMAGVKTFHVAYIATVASLANYATKAAAVFSGTQPIYQGEGAFLHHQNSAYASGRVHLLPTGSPDPSSPGSGDIAIFYTP
ncbi:MAG: hypothetical protein ACRCYS_10970 [Beijerinckiaceae bacterium]